MSLTMRSAHGQVLELQHQLEVALGACVDYHNLLVRGQIPDSVTGRTDLQTMYRRFGIELEPRSLFGERV